MNYRNKPRVTSIWLKTIIIALIATISVMAASKTFPTKEIDQRSFLETFTGHLEQRIPRLLNDYGIPGLNIALLRDGEVAWAKAFGYADLSRKQKMTIDTRCRVESISKSVTAWGVMKLVEQGKVDLYKPVEQYIRDWSVPLSEFSEEKITISRLLSHTAGLPLGTIGQEALYSTREILPPLRESLTKEVHLIREPGESFYYSDAGFNLLELLVEEVTGRDFSEYMKEEILIPLGMAKSDYTWSEEWDPPVPTGYRVNGEPVPVYTYSMKASGNLYSTLEDIAKFVSAGMINSSNDHGVLRQESIRKLYQPAAENISGIYGLVFEAYGFGHYLEWFSSGEKSISHGGQGTGWMSHFQSVPETGDGIVILANSQRSWPVFAYLLSDWTAWSGFSRAGMETIITAQKILWSVIGILVFIILWQLWSFMERLTVGGRKPKSKAEVPGVVRVAKIVTSLLMVFGVLYAVNMEYQPMFSIFPIASYWFFYSLLIAGLCMLLSALWLRT